LERRDGIWRVDGKDEKEEKKILLPDSL